MFSIAKKVSTHIGAKITPRLLRQPRIVCFKPDRAFLSSTPSLDDDDDFKPQSPKEITIEIAEGIADTTQFYMRYGLSRQRLEFLAQSEQPVLHKWQKMMEVFLMHVIGSIGYTANEQGLSKYAQDLQSCLQNADPDVQMVLTDIRRDTWREMVATAFSLDVVDIPSLGIVDARNHMHKVASKMMEPSVLLEIQTQTSKISRECTTAVV
ncbi:hypothetical protein FisN_6Lh339 [Fistulifera solaris]|uniref:Uncharacterized protein n=1 Tax=Fistulifera solaris TaxID=1519565 RepID=A0A1Z5JLB8_FISSO|nr:hypothetical protein FisN_6Lh339 [Fistulifera solaris]|eukprot:GAX14561.1 hypothetical protein FisN_6Lh339 [Fistulifera solaris]